MIGSRLNRTWNEKYRMIYFNMGHNDIDYENNTNKELSFTFDNEVQNKLILNALEWLGAGKKARSSSAK